MRSKTKPGRTVPIKVGMRLWNLDCDDTGVCIAIGTNGYAYRDNAGQIGIIAFDDVAIVAKLPKRIRGTIFARKAGG